MVNWIKKFDSNLNKIMNILFKILFFIILFCVGVYFDIEYRKSIVKDAIIELKNQTK